jgi:hypothetical protein
MSRAYLLLLLISGLQAQTASNVFDKAPPDVDAALRDRISKFYQAHVDKKFRLADQYVAEDSKDVFFAASKPSCMAFKIDSIVYSDNFTKAKSTVLCKQVLPFPGFGEEPMDLPNPDTWKVENGEWFWYLDLSRGRDTPWGHKDFTADKPGEIPGDIKDLKAKADPAAVMAKLRTSVKADKSAVRLSAQQVSDEVLISCAMDGISLRLDNAVAPGLKVTLDRTELKAGEQAKVTFQFTPLQNGAPRPQEVRVLVSPIGVVIPIEVSFQ